GTASPSTRPSSSVSSRANRAVIRPAKNIFPALLTALLFLAFLKLGPGGAWFGRSAHPLVGKAVYLLPFIYGIADYGENISSLIAFGDGASSGLATQLLPWMTRLKFASLVICFILIARLAVMRWLSSRDP
ncbi:hypothetical protein ACCT09_35440, partial [Rhizobium ruizarguesonis]